MPEDGESLEFRSAESGEDLSDEDLEAVPDSIEKISKRVLVWKDKDGVHGFGNIQYPQKEAITIPVQGKWRYLNWSASDAGEAKASKVDPSVNKSEADDGKQTEKSQPADPGGKKGGEGGSKQDGKPAPRSSGG